MLVIPEKSNVVLYVKELGYKSRREYYTSSLYSIIKEAILERDEGKCRAIGCEEGNVSQIGYANNSIANMVGKPYNLFSLCEKHYKAVMDLKSPPDTEKKQIDYVLALVSGIRKRQGYSDGNIGKWFWEQKKLADNLTVAQMIRGRLITLSPEEWNRVKEYW